MTQNPTYTYQKICGLMGRLAILTACAKASVAPSPACLTQKGMVGCMYVPSPACQAKVDAYCNSVCLQNMDHNKQSHPHGCDGPMRALFNASGRSEWKCYSPSTLNKDVKYVSGNCYCSSDVDIRSVLFACANPPAPSPPPPPPGNSTSMLPHIIFVVIDDLGSNDVGFRNGGEIYTPYMNSLRHSSIELSHYYTQPVCSPSRSALMTARYPIRFGLQHQVIWSGQPAGLFLNESTLPAQLKAAGYACHATGKWHVGFYTWKHTPAMRGFDSFFGFFGGGEDYFSHNEGSGSESPGIKLSSGFDFWHQPSPECGDGCAIPTNKGTNSTAGLYSTELFSVEAVRVIMRHNTSIPLFLYVPFQAVHGPLQAPQRYIDQNSKIANKARRTFAGMLTAADEGIGNITKALQARDMFSNSVIVVTTDNGGDTSQGGGSCPEMSYCKGSGNNYPLRGGKHTIWEGGVRGFAFMHAATIPPALRGGSYNGLMHITDWMPTLLGVANITARVSHFPWDGVNQWPAMQQSGSSVVDIDYPRSEVLIQLDNLAAAWRNETGDGIHSAIRVGKYKLILGPPGCPDNIFRPQNSTQSKKNCLRLPPSSVLLFDVESDPGETTDLAAKLPETVSKLQARLASYNATARQPFYPDNDPKADPTKHGGIWTPWQEDI